MVAISTVIGDHSVIDAFYDPDPDRRLAIIVLSGGNRNASAAGAFISIRRRRKVSAVRAVCGISSGIPTLAYLAGNGTATDVRVFMHDTNDRRLFNFWRRFQGKHPFDHTHLEYVFRHGGTGRGIKAEKVIESGIPFYAVMSCAHSGEPLLYRAETPDEVWQLAVIGSSITGVASPGWFRGRLVSDGFFTSALVPVNEMMHIPNPPTDILIFGGRHYDSNPARMGMWEELFHTTRYVRVQPHIRHMMRDRNIRLIDSVHAAMRREDVRVLSIWNSEKLPTLSISASQAQRLIKEGHATLEGLFRERGW